MRGSRGLLEPAYTRLGVAAGHLQAAAVNVNAGRRARKAIAELGQRTDGVEDEELQAEVLRLGDAGFHLAGPELDEGFAMVAVGRDRRGLCRLPDRHDLDDVLSPSQRCAVGFVVLFAQDCYNLLLTGGPTATQYKPLTSRMFITTCKAVNYRVILTQLVTF